MTTLKPVKDSIWKERGTWVKVTTVLGVTACISCPQCGTSGSLSRSGADGWKIAADGTVTPSVVCECGFHEFIRLEGWEPEIG